MYAPLSFSPEMKVPGTGMYFITMSMKTDETAQSPIVPHLRLQFVSFIGSNSNANEGMRRLYLYSKVEVISSFNFNLHLPMIVSVTVTVYSDRPLPLTLCLCGEDPYCL